MDLYRIQTLKTVIEHGSFSRAARQLSLTQSAISQQIKSLQDDLETTLIKKINGNLILTPEGRVFYEAIKQPLKNLNEAVLLTKKKSKSVHFKIKGPYIFLNETLLESLSKVEKNKSNSTYSISYGNSSMVNDSLLTGEIDIGFLSAPFSDKIATNHLIESDEMILVANSNYYNEIKDTLSNNMILLNMADMSSNLRLFRPWQELNKKIKVEPLLKAIIPAMEGIRSYIIHHPVATVMPKKIATPLLKRKEIVELFKLSKSYKTDLYISMLKKQKDPTISKLFNIISKIY